MTTPSSPPPSSPPPSSALPSWLEGARPVGGGSICAAYRATWQGRTVFAKTLADAPEGFFAAEDAGLRWLGATGAPVPEVLHVDEQTLVLGWVDATEPSATAAEQLGRDLARLHATPADAFGAPWPGFIGSLPMDNSTGFTEASSWPSFYAEQRVLPFLRRAVDRGAIDPSGARLVEQVCDRMAELAGPLESPRRIHGDLWSGNVLWAADGRPRLIDPAAHGGARETDLAMLALFGLPELPVVLAAYEQALPLPDGWRSRVPLHQLHPLLVHAALFGWSYGGRVTALASDLLRTGP